MPPWNRLQPVHTSLHWPRIDRGNFELAIGVVHRNKVALFNPQHARKPLFNFNDQEPVLHFRNPARTFNKLFTAGRERNAQDEISVNFLDRPLQRCEVVHRSNPYASCWRASSHWKIALRTRFMVLRATFWACLEPVSRISQTCCGLASNCLRRVWIGSIHLTRLSAISFLQSTQPMAAERQSRSMRPIVSGAANNL